MLLAIALLVSVPAFAKILVINIRIPLDQVPPNSPQFHIGDIHRARVIFDDAGVDPKTKRIKPIHMQHFVGGKWTPASADPVAMPMEDAWIDLTAQPIRFHYHSQVVEAGQAIIVDFDSDKRRMTIRPQANPEMVIVSGPYTIDAPSASGE